MTDGDVSSAVDMSPILSFFYVFCCAVAWFVLYLTFGLALPSKSAECHCRMVTVVHAVLVSSLAYWCGFVQGPWPFTDATGGPSTPLQHITCIVCLSYFIFVSFFPGGPSTPLQHITCIVCLSYFIFDFTWCLYYKTEGGVMLAHHMLSILGNTVTVYRGVYGCEMIATIFGTELTNPLLQLRWFLRDSGLHQTWLAEINDIVFMCLFGFLRIGVASNLLYCYFQNPRTDWFGRSGGTAIYLIGWVFWISILRYGFRKYSRMYHKNHPKTVAATNGHHKDSNGNAVTNGSMSKKID